MTHQAICINLSLTDFRLSFHYEYKKINRILIFLILSHPLTLTDFPAGESFIWVERRADTSS